MMFRLTIRHTLLLQNATEAMNYFTRLAISCLRIWPTIFTCMPKLALSRSPCLFCCFDKAMPEPNQLSTFVDIHYCIFKVTKYYFVVSITVLFHHHNVCLIKQPIYIHKVFCYAPIYIEWPLYYIYIVEYICVVKTCHAAPFWAAYGHCIIVYVLY